MQKDPKTSQSKPPELSQNEKKNQINKVIDTMSYGTFAFFSFRYDDRTKKEKAFSCKERTYQIHSRVESFPLTLKIKRREGSSGSSNVLPV